MVGISFDPFGQLVDPAAGNLEDESDEFYMLIGKCIKAWAQVEDRLFELYILASKDDRVRGAKMFFDLPGAGARLKKTDAAIRKASLDVDRWEVTRASIAGKLNVRNLLAHSPVRRHTNYFMSTSGAKPNRAESWMVVAISENERIAGKTSPPARGADLLAHLNGVEQDAVALDAFYKSLDATQSPR